MYSNAKRRVGAMLLTTKKINSKKKLLFIFIIYYNKLSLKKEKYFSLQTQNYLNHILK